MIKIHLIGLALLLVTATGAQADSLCFDEAGSQYGINPKILRAIAKVESNFNPRAINWNANGSYDFGVMQINSSWVSTLGLERWNTLGDACSNVKTGAMILATCMKKYGYTWEAIGCYNSQTPDKRDRYAQLVFKQLQRIERDDRRLKDELSATVGDQLAELVKKSLDKPSVGPGPKAQALVSAPPETPRASPSLGPSAAAVSQGPELRASSQFEVTTNGL